MDTQAPPLTRLRSAACGLVWLVAVLAAPAVHAQTDTMYFPAVDNVTNVLVSKINAETVRIDMSAWYLTEHSVSIALINAFNRGVPVRLIGDRGSIFEIDVKTKNEFYWLASQGLPIRLRYNPTWFPEIAHWKTTIFKGQRLVAFGSANYTPGQLAPFSSTDYSDETVLFSTDSALVNAFLTKFDVIWNDTTIEPNSRYGAPPYLKNWNDACALESGCSDYRTRYPNPAPMTINTARLEGNAATPTDLIWSQGPEFNDRLVQEINAESARIRFVIYRLTVDNITQALLGRHQAGIPMQLIVEPSEYLNSKWPEFWLTHANIDKLWAAGVPIRERAHNGLTHMKMLVTSRYATNASSNFAANWQRDQNYFVSASTKPTVYQAMVNRFDTMWNDTAGFRDFVPRPPATPALSSPASGSTGVSRTPTLTWNRATFATSYDIYLGTSPSTLSRIGNRPAELTDNPPATYSWTVPTTLAGGTTHYWKVVARTFATDRDAGIVASSSTWSFTTSGSGGGGGGGALPSPWVQTDIGSVGATGNATYSNGTFSVSGAGADIWGSADGFHYVYQPLSGDGQIVARVASIGNTNTYAKAGVMLREQLTSGSKHVLLDVRPGGGIEFMTRSATGGATTYLGGASQSPPAWLRLARSGSTVTASVSSNGSTWTTVGSTTVSLAGSVSAGLVVCSHVSGTLMTATFDSVSVTGGSTPPPPPPPPSGASDIVIYAGDIPQGNLHGSWSRQADGSAAGGLKLVTSDVGFASANNALSSPADYVDVTFAAEANTPYTIWLRMQALNNNKYNDAVWVQFSDARVGGASAYPVGTTSGLLVNLATSGTATSLSGWGWQNTAYWLSQATTVTFPTSGTRTLRIQVREDGVQFDQIVLSPGRYLSTPPGGVSNDTTIVAK